MIVNNEVEEIKQETLPMGLLASMQHSSVEKEVTKGMYVVLMSDGAESDVNKQELQTIVEKLSVLEYTEKDLMNAIMDRIVGRQNRITLDDVTVIVCKII